MLAHEMETNPLVTPYHFATPGDVPRLLRERGNPYLHFWEQVDGNQGDFLNDWRRIPPAFADREKLQAALGPGWCSPATLERDPSFLATMAAHLCRHYGVNFYAWAIPSPAALHVLAELDKPILELGAGRGYWARQLERAGVRIVTEEINATAYEWYWRCPDRTTRRTLPSDHALLFCWPTNGDRWAFNRLREFQGDTVAYVGEWDACTAEPLFHRELEMHWHRVAEVSIPQWEGIHDELTTWRRQ